MNLKVSLIIVHWNTPENLRKLLNSVKGIKNAEIIVVDNNSSTTLNWLKADFKQVDLIQNQINRGYSFACNQGALKAEGEWLLFLNPDVLLSEKTIFDMIAYARENNLDACSPKPLSDNYNKPIPSTLSILAEFTPLRKLINHNSFPDKTLTGGCLLIKKDVLQKLDGWDERFFLWFEDSDLTQRLIAKKFHIGWFDGNISHIGGVSFNKLDEQYKKDVFFSSLEIYANKHFSSVGQTLVSFIKKRYSKRKLMPQVFDGVSITVPNMNETHLHNFFRKNRNALNSIDELIIVSSGINTESYWKVKKELPECRIIRIDKNRGFAATVNTGFKVAGGTWVGTVNDDVELSPNWIKKCLDCASDQSGSINPVVLKTDSSVESAGVGVELKGKANPIKEVISESCNIVDATNAAAVLYSRDALNKIGLFDERFGSYLEDIDLSLRLTKNGFTNIVVSEAKIIHEGQSTSSTMGVRKQYLDLKNWILVILKNWGLKNIVIYLPAILIERLRNLSGFIKAVIK